MKMKQTNKYIQTLNLQHAKHTVLIQQVTNPPHTVYLLVFATFLQQSHRHHHDPEWPVREVKSRKNEESYVKKHSFNLHIQILNIPWM